MLVVHLSGGQSDGAVGTGRGLFGERRGMNTRRIWLAIVGAAAVTLVAAAAIGAQSSSGTKSSAATRSLDTTLSLVAYSTPREAMGKLIPAFQATADGQGVGFNQSYGASGDQARAVQAGLKADIVYLSLAPDVDTLVKAGLVDSKWNKQSYKGIVTDSVVVFVVRDGNPKHIKSWDDLLKPGVQVVT